MNSQILNNNQTTAKLLIIPGALMALLASGCAYNQAPIVDTSGVSPQQYEQDLAYCHGFAMQVDKNEAANVAATNSAATGAGTGAIVGLFEDGVGGAIVGGLVGGAIGGVAGNIEGRLEATDDQARVLRNCLKDKGYKVYDRETS